MPATQMASLLRRKKLSAREVMQAHLRQIERVNAKVNAIVTLVPQDALMAQALAADEAIARRKWLGPLHGLPIGVKDLHEAKGERTTYGSPLNEGASRGRLIYTFCEHKNGYGGTGVPDWQCSNC